MHHIAILGFGVVGRGCADLLRDNEKETAKLGGEEIAIRCILDLRDFPNTEYEKKVVHDFSMIEADPDVKTVIETMGGSHPAYEYTVRALKSGKNVITSNKEVVANYGDEFLKLAEENGVCYRFEAAVGGGIPVLSPIIGFLRQNKLREVRGILNGTTNYILTEMFSFGKSFDSALADAQEKGYAERNPDADILGIDACRKIVILTALVTGKLYPVDCIHTEGITGIRPNDVKAADKLGCHIKLLGRCLVSGEKNTVMVAPFLLSRDLPLANTLGVYNAVEVIGDPIQNVVFYGRGAGAGPTASAVIGDLMQIMKNKRHAAFPSFEKEKGDLADFAGYTGRTYLAVRKTDSEKAKKVFPTAEFFDNDGETALITDEMSEHRLTECLAASALEPLSRIRILH